jgi:predicted RNA-binding protein with PIN domain
MYYLVDAYNLLFRTLKKSGTLEKKRQRMIEELNDAISQISLQVTLVFDGAEEHLPYTSRGHFDAIELVYTSKNKSADEYISDEVILSKSPTQITVVTNDRELATRCRNHRAGTMTIDEFLAFVSKKRAKKKRASTSPRDFSASSSEFARLLLIFEKKLLEELNDDLD